MARARLTKLAKLFAVSQRPLYAVDAGRTIVYANPACEAWTGVTCEGLLGQRCDFHTPPDPESFEAVVAALCPPPAALAGQTIEDWICLAAQGRPPRYRQALFLPLADEQRAVLVVVSTDDHEELPDSAVSEPAATAVHLALQRCRALQQATFHADRLVGSSPASRRIREQAALAAGSDAAVLITGPAGSGRRHLAQTIHYTASPSGQLIRLDGGLVDGDMLGSAIVRSSIEEARTTLLLENAEQLAESAQRELAANLAANDGFRVVTTAQSSLEQLAAEGRFHVDLACALSTLWIELPALAARPQDLPLLAQQFLEECNRGGGKQLGGFTAEALDLLAGYLWPGNLDELAEVVAAAHAAAESYQVTSSDLPQRIHLKRKADLHPPRPIEVVDLDALLREVEIEVIEQALGRAKGNKAQAARMLGLSRPRLYRRLVQLGLEGDEEGDDG